jgi:plasmid stabilization system protein ParE
LAQEDLLEIWENISEDNPPAAVRLVQTFSKKFDQILAFPEIGQQRNDIMLHMRSVVVRRYIIFYQITRQNIEIWRSGTARATSKRYSIYEEKLYSQ